MEFGLISKLQQTIVNPKKKVQVIFKSHELDELDSKAENREISSLKERELVENQERLNYKEVVLENTSFGFSITDEDFFVKSPSEDTTNHCTTDTMMKIKINLLQEEKDI